MSEKIYEASAAQAYLYGCIAEPIRFLQGCYAKLIARLFFLEPGTAQVHRKDDARNEEHRDADACEVADALQAAVRREQEPDKARDGRGGTCHHVTAGGIHQLTERQILVAHPRGNHVNRGVDSDTERHRDNNHVVDAYLPEFKHVGEEPEKPESAKQQAVSCYRSTCMC